MDDDSGAITSYDITAVVDQDLTGTASEDTGIIDSNFIAADVYNNVTSSPQNVVYTVVPYYGLCPGPDFTITVTVNPEPVVGNQEITACSNATLNTFFSAGSGVTPDHYIVDTLELNGLTIASGDPMNDSSALSLADDTYINNTNATVDVVYTVIPVSVDGCEGNSFEVTVHVLPRLTVDVVNNGASTICGNDSATLTVTTVGAQIGMWSTSGTGVISPNVTNSDITYVPSASDIDAGTVTLTYTATNICESVSDSVVILINPAPVTSAGMDTVICDGESTTLTATGADSYSWSNGDTTDAITVSPSTTTTYTVTGTIGSCTSTDEVTVTVNSLPSASISASQSTICVGASTTLTANGGSGYTYLWSNGATTQSITVSPSATTTYTVDVTNANGCTSASSASQVITVNPLPVATISGTTTVCAGTSTTLTASAGSSYLWSNGDTTASITVTHTSTTAYSVTITNASGCSSTSVVTNVIVNQLPVVSGITGATSVCAGLSTQLLSATTGGTWSTSDNNVASVSTSGLVTGVAAGSATITYTVTNGNGCTSSQSAVINVNSGITATITAGGATTFCSGDNVVLTASSGATYLWSNGAQTQSITVTTSGSYYVTVTSASGCSAVSAATTVTANPLPVVAGITGSTTLCQGLTTQFANATSGGTWSSSDSNIASISASGIVTGVAVGTATIIYTYTNGNGCTSSTSALITINSGVTPTISADGPTTFCPRGTVTLTASAGASYLWSNGAQTQSITVTTSGSYYVTVSNASGCSAVSTATTVTVSDTTVPTITAPATVNTTTNNGCYAFNVSLGSPTAADN